MTRTKAIRILGFIIIGIIISYYINFLITNPSASLVKYRYQDAAPISIAIFILLFLYVLPIVGYLLLKILHRKTDINKGQRTTSHFLTISPFFGFITLLFLAFNGAQGLILCDRIRNFDNKSCQSIIFAYFGETQIIGQGFKLLILALIVSIGFLVVNKIASRITRIEQNGTVKGIEGSLIRLGHAIAIFLALAILFTFASKYFLLNPYFLNFN